MAFTQNQGRSSGQRNSSPTTNIVRYYSTTEGNDAALSINTWKSATRSIVKSYGTNIAA